VCSLPDCSKKKEKKEELRVRKNFFIKLFGGDE
jgi:hypothetical protein